MNIVRGKKIEVLFSASTIAMRNLELAKEIAGRDYHDLLVISILKGSFVFAADLIRAMHDAGLAPEVEFITISSYGAGTVSGEVKVLRDIDNVVEGRDVLLIDDILESGKTLKFTRELMLSRGAKSVSTAVCGYCDGRRVVSTATRTATTFPDRNAQAQDSGHRRGVCGWLRGFPVHAGCRFRPAP